MTQPEQSQSEDDADAGRAPERPERRAQPGDADGPLTSRPPWNPISYGGEDWLTLSLYISHRDFERLAARLERHRQAAEDREKCKDELVLAGHRFITLPAGAKVGSRRNGAYFRWQIQSESGFVLQLMNHRACDSSAPNGKLIAPSMVMMRLGIETVYQHAFDAIMALGAKIERNKVSRIDVCADLPDRSIEPLKKAFAAGHAVHRADVNDEHCEALSFVETDFSIYCVRRETTSFNLGRGDVRLRVYEKFRECRHDIAKLKVLVNSRWGEFPYRAIRVEFQLRRKKLRKLGVDGLAEWYANRATIVNYLTHEWFRLTDGPVDRKHPERSRPLAEWVDVQQAFACWAGNGPFPEVKPIRSQGAPPDQYLKSVVGLLSSLFAKTGIDIDSNETFLHEGLYRILDEIEDRNMAEEVRRKRLEFGIGGAKEEPC